MARSRLKTFLIYLPLLYISVVAILAIFPFLQPYFIYFHWVRYPLGDLSKGEYFGYRSGSVRNFYLTTPDNKSLGTWHIVTKHHHPYHTDESRIANANDKPGSIPFYKLQVLSSNVTEERKRQYFEGGLKKAKWVFLYLHGNAATRAAPSRLGFYNRLLSTHPESQLLAIDYRGFGDSSFQTPTEETLLIDSLTAWDYLIANEVSPSQIIVVGHSLASKLVHFLETERNLAPAGMLLISPFKSIPEVALDYPMFPLLRPFSYSPVLSDFAKSLVQENLNTISFLPSILRTPILILHGREDLTIPINHGIKCYETAVSARLAASSSSVTVKKDFESEITKIAIGLEGELWEFNPSKSRRDAKTRIAPVWFLQVSWAGHNYVERYDVVIDAVEGWLNVVDGFWSKK
ncbi:Alpha/Beta hydrolase protein [Paraphysoderma sedebokerense]|nr:Alpha/Beta hydrolase protein [Paraphysoderma sedebokerense]